MYITESGNKTFVNYSSIRVDLRTTKTKTIVSLKFVVRVGKNLTADSWHVSRAELYCLSPQGPIGGTCHTEVNV